MLANLIDLKQGLNLIYLLKSALVYSIDNIAFYLKELRSIGMNEESHCADFVTTFAEDERPETDCTIGASSSGWETFVDDFASWTPFS